jgi:hypothetical protein
MIGATPQVAGIGAGTVINLASLRRFWAMAARWNSVVGDKPVWVSLGFLAIGGLAQRGSNVLPLRGIVQALRGRHHVTPGICVVAYLYPA